MLRDETAKPLCSSNGVELDNGRTVSYFKGLTVKAGGGF